MRVGTKGRHGTVKGKTETGERGIGTNWAELTCLLDSNHRAHKENHFCSAAVTWAANIPRRSPAGPHPPHATSNVLHSLHATSIGCLPPKNAALQGSVAHPYTAVLEWPGRNHPFFCISHTHSQIKYNLHSELCNIYDSLDGKAAWNVELKGITETLSILKLNTRFIIWFNCPEFSPINMQTTLSVVLFPITTADLSRMEVRGMITLSLGLTTHPFHRLNEALLLLSCNLLP